MNEREGSKEGEGVVWLVCMFGKMRRINENSKSFVIGGFWVCCMEV